MSFSGGSPSPMSTGRSAASPTCNPWLPQTNFASSGTTSNRVRNPSFFAANLRSARPFGHCLLPDQDSSHPRCGEQHFADRFEIAPIGNVDMRQLMIAHREGLAGVDIELLAEGTRPRREPAALPQDAIEIDRPLDRHM